MYWMYGILQITTLMERTDRSFDSVAGAKVRQASGRSFRPSGLSIAHNVSANDQSTASSLSPLAILQLFIPLYLYSNIWGENRHTSHTSRGCFRLHRLVGPRFRSLGKTGGA